MDGEKAAVSQTQAEASRWVASVRTRTVLARAEPLVMMHLGVLNQPDYHRDNRDQQHDPEHQHARGRVVAYPDSSDARSRTAIDLVRSRADRLWTGRSGSTHGGRR